MVVPGLSPETPTCLVAIISGAVEIVLILYICTMCINETVLNIPVDNLVRLLKC